MKKLLHIVPYIVVVGLVIFVLRSFLHPGIPSTHDGHSHLARIANYYLSLRDGQFPVRWAPNLNFKFGYPVFNFFYQLPYLFSTILYKFGLSIESSFKVTIGIFILSGNLALFEWLRRKYSVLAGLAGVLLYLSAPPFLLQVFVRGAFGEILAWSLLPVSMLSIYLYSHSQESRQLKWWLFLIVSLFLLLLSHHMLFALCLPLLIIYGLIEIKGKTVMQVSYFAAAFILAFGLGAFFILPALLESKYTYLANASQTKEFSDHFVKPLQFFYSLWDYGYSKKGDADTMSFMLGWGQIGVFLLGLYCFIRHKIINKAVLGLFIVVFLISLLFMSEVSSWVWHLIPLLSQIQFPWRLFIVTAFSLTVIGAIGLHMIQSKLLSVVLALVCFVQILVFAKPKALMHLSEYEYFEFPFTSSVSNEVMPKDFQPIIEPEKFAFDIKDESGLADITITHWQSGLHRYDIESTQSATYIERLAYFPGWETQIDGVMVSNNGPIQQYPGMINYIVPAGKHTVETKFTEHTPARRTGNIISVISVVSIAGLSLVMHKKAYDKNS